MPNSEEILQDIIVQVNSGNNPNEVLYNKRKESLQEIYKLTNRNIIAYYSGWLQRPDVADTEINDKDKSGFMLAINKMDKTKGLDLLLHTPGGDIAATESLVDYLYSIFDKDIRVIVPQISMSAGTMIALSSREIIMGKHSNLGPIDPQMGGVACQAILQEFEEAKADVANNPNNALLWQTIIGKYQPTLLLQCRNAIEWSRKMVLKWLKFNMCYGNDARANNIIEVFADHNTQKSHARHISIQECKNVGLNIEELENDQSLQDAVLSAHHVYMHTFSNTGIIKLIENHKGATHFEEITI